MFVHILHLVLGVSVLFCSRHPAKEVPTGEGRRRERGRGRPKS